MSTADTCRRGHERTPENVRERVLRRNGREQVIRECRACARLTAAARKAGVSPALLTRMTEASEAPAVAGQPDSKGCSRRGGDRG